MLYLIVDRRDDLLVKIGVTASLEARMRVYRTCNPLAELRESAEVSSDCAETQVERDCHKYLLDCGCERIRTTEWFKVPPDFTAYHFEDIEQYYQAEGTFKDITQYTRTSRGTRAEKLLNW